MIVDDSLMIVRSLSALLRELGHDVIKTASAGTKALEAYRECNPDIVTMDITMPDLDGIQATEKILAEFPQACIIMVTSQGQEGMVMKAIKTGAKGYILKPIKQEKLREVMTFVSH